MNKSEDQREISQHEAEITLIYLNAIKACKKWNWWHQLKRWESFYKLQYMKKIAKKPRLEGQGKSNSIMFIGINPSVRSGFGNIWEDPFGKYFSSFLSEAGISPREVYMTNVYKYPTEDNRAPFPNEIRRGWPELEAEIAFNDPTVIVTLGKLPEAILKTGGYDIIPLLHPAYVKRAPTTKVEFIKKLKQIKKIHEQKRIRKESLGRRKDRRGSN